MSSTSTPPCKAGIQKFVKGKVTKAMESVTEVTEVVTNPDTAIHRQIEMLQSHRRTAERKWKVKKKGTVKNTLSVAIDLKKTILVKLAKLLSMY